MLIKSSTHHLLQSPLPEDLLEIDAQKLIDLLNEASNGRLTIEKSTQKVHQLRDLAQDSFGIRVATDVYKLQIQLLLQQILDRKSTRLNSSHVAISYAVFCLKKHSASC